MGKRVQYICDICAKEISPAVNGGGVSVNPDGKVTEILGYSDIDKGEEFFHTECLLNAAHKTKKLKGEG